ncbi:MAG TPA: TlpA disulfide reductase family protein [Phycisphaerae bacterium]|nr:TlpA disulfide reductase family protein [Phycisphaerae bacterium]
MARPTTRPTTSRPAKRLLPIGSPAPKFDLPALSGAHVYFPEAYGGQLVLIQVWASWCSSCARDFPYWITAQEKFGGMGLTLLGISIDDDRNIGMDKVLTTMQERGCTWDVVYKDAQNRSVLGRYLAPTLPTLYLIDGDTGRIIDAGNDLRRGRLLQTLEKHLRAKFPGQFPTSQPADPPTSQPTAR